MASLLNMSGAGLLNKSVPQDVNFVDMGLPSGTLWAKGNIVKDAQGNYFIGNETDYGCYFSWGNIDGHNEYEEDSYSFDQTNYDASAGASLTGNIPSDDALHDAAVARLGGNWHMPTTANFQELFNSNYTTNVWTTQNGINGRLVTSKANGNSLFFPASGYRYGSGLNNQGRYGYHWSSLFLSATFAYDMNFYNGNVYPVNSFYRWYGLTFRPVK